MLYKISYLRIYFISIIGYVIPKWIVVQEILQMRVLNVCIQLASLLSTLAIIKGKNYAFEKWDRFTLNTIEYRIEYREENFLGFEFLVRNEEIDGHSHEERGIFEESFSPIFIYIFYYIYYQKGAQLFFRKPSYFWNKIFDP